MDEIKELTGLLKQVVEQNTQALALAERVIALVEEEKKLDCWATGNETEKKLKGLFSDRSLRTMAADGRLIHGQHFIKEGRSYKFNPAAIKAYFKDSPEFRPAG